MTTQPTCGEAGPSGVGDNIVRDVALRHDEEHYGEGDAESTQKHAREGHQPSPAQPRRITGLKCKRLRVFKKGLKLLSDRQEGPE